jgi:hypothetical protein
LLVNYGDYVLFRENFATNRLLFGFGCVRN